MEFKTIYDEIYITSCKAFNTAMTDGEYMPASGSFVDVSGYRKFAFLIVLGALDSNTTFAVYQDTSATATAGIKAITGASQAVTATDDDKWLTIEVDAANLDVENGYRYVTLRATGPAGNNDYAAVLFIGWGARRKPVTQRANYAYYVELP